jgi:hypothetical protein
VEAPSKRPSYLPETVLWYYEDCQRDTSAGPIVTEANKRRPKMQLAIRRGDGSIISAPEYDSIRRSADIVVDNLIKLSLSTSHTSLSTHAQTASKVPTKSNIRKWFKVEYSQAIFELEAEQKLLRLCSGHWKADTMIGQAFLRQSDAECRRAAICMCAISAMPDLNQLHPGPAPTPQVSDLVRTNVVKRSLELSPGPKSPSASHIQKRSKDASTISRPKITGPSVHSDCK